MEKLVLAIRHLIKTSCTAEAFIDYCSEHSIELDWAIMAWANLNSMSMIKFGKYPRYIEPNMLGQIKLTESNRSCRLCGHAVKPPKYNWHAECWEALKPFTSIGWNEQLYKTIYANDYKCQACSKRTTQLQGDHILPIALGGLPYKENLQILCTSCHQEKTKQDMVMIRQSQKNH